MVKLRMTAYYLTLMSIIIMYATQPSSVQCMMMKMKKMKGMGGGGGGVMELLIAGIVAKLLQDMKGGSSGGLSSLFMKGGSHQQMKPKFIPVPILVASHGGMMDSGWSGGMMDSGWKGGMMMNSGGYKGGMMMNNGWKGNMMMGGD